SCSAPGRHEARFGRASFVAWPVLIPVAYADPTTTDPGGPPCPPPAFVATLSPLLSLALLAGCGDLLGEPGNGHRVSAARAAAGFAAIDSSDSLDVDISQGDTFAVTVSIDSNLIDRVETRFSGQTLFIDVRGSIRDYVAGPHVMVTMPVLADAAVSG